MKKALEPYVKLAPFLGIGLVVVAIGIGWTFYMQRGAHIDLITSIQKVRTLALDENSAAAIIDFRLQNPADYPFVVRRVEATMVDPAGKTLDGAVVSEVDAKQLFQYYSAALGQKYNDTLLIRTWIKPHQTIDRMLAVRFEVPEKLVEQRRNLTITIEDMSGPVVHVVEHGKP